MYVQCFAKSLICIHIPWELGISYGFSIAIVCKWTSAPCMHFALDFPTDSSWVYVGFMQCFWNIYSILLFSSPWIYWYRVDSRPSWNELSYSLHTHGIDQDGDKGQKGLGQLSKRHKVKVKSLVLFKLFNAERKNWSKSKGKCDATHYHCGRNPKGEG